MSDDNDFYKAMDDVKPLRNEKRVILKKASTPDTVHKIRREAAENHPVTSEDPLADGEVKQLDAYSVLEFCRPGVQHGAYKQFRLGKYPIDARLDLHQMVVEQARRAVIQFVKDCINHDIRCCLIAHGKGENRKQPAILKSYLSHWLPQIEEVLAFHSAQPQHGGVGACYIMLKKSQKKRQENLERHQRRL